MGQGLRLLGTLALPAGGQRDEFVARLVPQVYVRVMELPEFVA